MVWVMGVESSHCHSVDVIEEKQGLSIRPENTGCYDGSFAPILVEFVDGKPRLCVWADINKQDPTHIIDLSGAMESARKEE